MGTPTTHSLRCINGLRGRLRRPALAGVLAGLTPAAVQAAGDGALSFLAEPPQRAVYEHENVIRLDADSVKSGWARLEQCHDNFDAANLDRVPRAQIVYREGGTRDLSVESHRDIDEARVEDSSVQLRGIGGDARLCVTARTRMLHANDDGSYTLRNGPFMRRFLDGYYPMHVTLEVHLPGPGWTLTRTEPAEQPGFAVRRTSGTVHIDAWFEGRLETRLHLRPPRVAEARQ